MQVFRHDGSARDAILFCPGFPGMGASLFEQQHANALTEAGFDVYVIHHKGTRTNAALSPALVNNGKRLQDAWEARETHLGGGAVSMEELLAEPYVVLKDIAGAYEGIHVIGNSFGALSALQALTTPDAPTERVRTLTLIAGAQGVDDGSDECVMRIWREEFLGNPRINDQIEVIDLPGAIATLKNLYRDLPKRVMNNLPGAIALTYVVVEKDEILRLSDTQAFQAAIGGRGIIIMEQDDGWPAYGITPHYTAKYKTSSLLKLIRG